MYSKFAFLEAKLNLRTSSKLLEKKYLNHTSLKRYFLDLLKYVIQGVPHLRGFHYRGSHTAIFGLCTRKWGIFELVGDPLQSH